MMKKLAHLALLLTAFFWGIQYLIYNQLPPEIPSLLFLSLSNMAGILVILLFMPAKKMCFPFALIKPGCILGCILFLFNLTLIDGTRLVPSCNAAFLASLYILFIPVCMLFKKQFIDRYQLLAIIITLTGVYLGTGTQLDAFLETGSLYILAADFLFAVYMLLLEKWISDKEPVAFSVCQMTVVSLLSFIAAFFFLPQQIYTFTITPYIVLLIILAGIFVKGLSTILQVYGQKQISATKASLLLSTEIIFTIVSAAILTSIGFIEDEPLTVSKITGCLLIIIGVFVSQKKTRE